MLHPMAEVSESSREAEKEDECCVLDRTSKLQWFDGKWLSRIKSTGNSFVSRTYLSKCLSHQLRGHEFCYIIQVKRIAPT